MTIISEVMPNDIQSEYEGVRVFCLYAQRIMYMSYFP